MILDYRRPADPSVWYAPETLVWCLVLLVAPLLVALLLQRLLDSVPEVRPRTRVSPTLYLFLVMLGSNVAFGLESELFSVEAEARQWATVNTSPGLPAASALLFLPSLCLAIAAFFRHSYQWRDRPAATWLVWLGGGCLLAGLFILWSGERLYAGAWIVFGLLLLLAGLMTGLLRQPG